MCGEAISYQDANAEPYTFTCMLRPGHKGVHYCQTVQGGIAWPTPRYLRPWP